MGALTKRYKEHTLLRFGVVTLTFSFLGWAIAPYVPVLMVILIPLSLSSGILSTILRSSLSKSVLPGETGEIMGTSAAMESLTRIAAQALGGYLLGVATWTRPAVIPVVGGTCHLHSPIIASACTNPHGN